MPTEDMSSSLIDSSTDFDTIDNLETEPDEPAIEGDSDTSDALPTYYSITSYGADYPVDGLVKRIQRGDIYIPKFQRSYVWKIEQASRFIESLLFGLPVPGIFLAKDSENKLIVIDGQQRLRTLQYFYEGQFPFGSDSSQYKEFSLQAVAAQFSGKTYKTLSGSDKRQLDDSILPATIVRQDEPDVGYDPEQTSMYHIFERLNTCGTQLFPQEIRAAIYHGLFNELLNNLNEYENWQKIFQGKKSAKQPDTRKRMKDRELILRFLALYFSLDSYKESMKDFLNIFMKKNQSLDQHQSFEFQRIFYQTIDTLYVSIGEKAFRPRRGLHAAVFDAVMVGTARRLDKGEISNPASLKSAYDHLLKDEKFLEVSINSRQMTNTKNVHERVKLATEAFKDLL